MEEYLYLPTEMFMDEDLEWRLVQLEDLYLVRYEPDRQDMLFRCVNYPYKKQIFPVEFMTDPALRWRWRHLLALYNTCRRKLYVQMDCLVPALKKMRRNICWEDDKCPICAEDLCERGGRVDVEPCGHSFHAGCIKKWIAKSATCPVCRGYALKKTPDRAPEELCKLLVSVTKEEADIIC